MENSDLRYWIEVQDDVLALVVAEGDFLVFVGQDGEIRRLRAFSWNRHGRKLVARDSWALPPNVVGRGGLDVALAMIGPARIDQRVVTTLPAYRPTTRRIASGTAGTAGPLGCNLNGQGTPRSAPFAATLLHAPQPKQS